METEGELTRKLSQAKKEVLEADEMAEKNEQELKARIKELENRPIEVAVEREAAQKKLKASDGKVAAFGVYFKSVQENFNSMMEKVREIGEEDPETSKKLCGAARVILQKAIERLGTEE